MPNWRVSLVRTGDAGRMVYARDVDARTYYDAVSMIEQRAVVEHPGEVYEFESVTRIWRPKPDAEISGVPA